MYSDENGDEPEHYIEDTWDESVIWKKGAQLPK